MANVQTAAIITRIREVIEDGRGAKRTIAAGTYLGNWPEGLSEAEQKRRALVHPRTRVDISLSGRSPNSPPINGNLIIYDATVTVKASRLLDRAKALVPNDYDAVQAAGTTDADIVRQALEYPDNLKQTEAAVATDIVSGMLRWGSSSFEVIGAINDGAQRLEGTHNFTAQLIARPA